jgi:DNA adenine methylase
VASAPAATRARVPSRRGILHTSFDHDEFAAELQQCHHEWLVTYDDSECVRKNFSFASLYEWELQYGMNNYKQGSAAKGKELFIANYRVRIGEQLTLAGI